jgi:uncharacterized protein (TIRG00374 family)
MTIATSPAKPLRRTRLRDYGAFQADISTLCTREVPAAKVYDRLGSELLSTEMVIFSREDIVTGSTPTPQISFLAQDLLSVQNSIAIPNERELLILPEVLQQREVQEAQVSPTEVQQKPTKKRLNVIIRFGATIVLFAILFRSISWSALWSSFAHVHHPELLIGLSIGTLGVVISSYQWRVLLQGETIRFDLADLINLYLVGTAFSHFLPTGMGGDAVKAVYVGRESGKSEGSASAVVMSRVTGFFGMLLIAIAVLIFQFQHFSLSVMLWFLILSLIVGGMIFGAVFFVTLLPKIFKGKWTQHRIFASASNIGKALSATAKRPRSLGIATIYGTVFWVIACLNYYAYAIAIGMHVPLYFYFVAIPLVSLVTFLPISINGFGIRESAFVYIFSTVHVSSTTSLLLALLMDAQVLFFGVVGGCLYFSISSQKSKKKDTGV